MPSIEDIEVKISGVLKPLLDAKYPGLIGLAVRSKRKDVLTILTDPNVWLGKQITTITFTPYSDDLFYKILPLKAKHQEKYPELIGIIDRFIRILQRNYKDTKFHKNS